MNDPKDKSEPFLSRWARRKQDVARGRIDDSAPATAKVDDDAESINAASLSDAEKEPELDLSTLPKAEDLTAESDITAFLDKRVPAMLRNAALGRMWTLDPTIRDFIEVAENQWNWNVPGGAPFYGPMEAVISEAGETGMQVGDAVARAVEPTGSAAGVASSTVQPESIELKDESRSIDVEAAAAAPPNNAHTNNAAPADEEVVDVAYPLGNYRDAATDAAPQHAVAVGGGFRRRHGGALPG